MLQLQRLKQECSHSSILENLDDRRDSAFPIQECFRRREVMRKGNTLKGVFGVHEGVKHVLREDNKGFKEPDYPYIQFQHKCIRFSHNKQCTTHQSFP